jgi:hypothetical protein
VDTYTEKGGYGPNTSSSFHLYSENISIFARVRDASDNPIANAEVTFDIRGPPNSNITLTETAKTNSSGVAVVTVTIPYLIDLPETTLGIWTAVATAEIAGTQIVDSLAFEVKAPPNPFVDVYTDHNGKGLNTPSQPYDRGSAVHLYAEVSNGTGPLENHWVTFAAYGPTNQTTFVTTQPSNSSGIAATTFTIPEAEDSLGTWRVIATVKIKNQVFMDALTFDCNA